MRNFDCAHAVAQRNGKGVVADDTDGSELRRGRQGSIAGCRQQKIAVDFITAFERDRLAGTSQGPELLAVLEYTCRFQLLASDFSQVTVELQDLRWLHDLIPLRDH